MVHNSLYNHKGINMKTKSLLVPLLLLFCLVLIFVAPKANAALGPPSAIRFTPSPTSVLADGVSKINVGVFSFFYKCNSGNYATTLAECANPTNMGYSGVEVTWKTETTNLSGDAGLSVSVS